MADKSYYFTYAENTDTTCRLLEKVVEDKKLAVEINLEKRLVIDTDGKKVSDKLSGLFRNYEGQHITFTVPLSSNGDNLFAGIEFSPFDLQEFDEDGKLSKFTDSIIQKLNEVYLRHREAHELGNYSKYVFQRPVNKHELSHILHFVATASDSNFKFTKETKEGIFGEFFSRKHGDLYIHFGVHIDKSKKYTVMQFADKEIHDSSVNCERSAPYLVEYVRSLVSQISKVDASRKPSQK